MASHEVHAHHAPLRRHAHPTCRRCLEPECMPPETVPPQKR